LQQFASAPVVGRNAVRRMFAAAQQRCMLVPSAKNVKALDFKFFVVYNFSVKLVKVILALR
jgi:hypothetical protein